MEIMGIFALLGTILTIISGAITNSQNQQNANEQLESQQSFSHNEAELANQRALDNYWETMSPQAKVQQYKDAGLSVGLMYGGAGTGGGVNAGTQAQTPGANLPVMLNPMLGSMTEIIENLKKIEEKENISEDTEKKKQEIEEIKSKIDVNNATIEKIATDNNLTKVLTANSEIDGQIRQIEANIAKATEQQKIEIVGQTLQNLKNEGLKLLEEIKGLQIDNDKKEEIYNATLAKLSAETVLIWKEVARTEAETILTNAKTKLTNEQAGLTYAERQLTWKKVTNYETLIAEIDAQIKVLETEADLKDEQTRQTKVNAIQTLGGMLMPGYQSLGSELYKLIK